VSRKLDLDPSAYCFFFSENGDSVVQMNRESLAVPEVILNVVDDLGNYL
jgi:hypothetical protein